MSQFNNLTAVGGYTLIAFMCLLVSTLFCCGCYLKYRADRDEREREREQQSIQIQSYGTPNVFNININSNTNINTSPYPNTSTTTISASDEEINTLCKERFKEQEQEQEQEQEHGNHDTCVICLAEYTHGDTLFRLHCKHRFHQKCLTIWLHKKRVCPVCARDIDPEKEHRQQMSPQQRSQWHLSGVSNAMRTQSPYERHRILRLSSLEDIMVENNILAIQQSPLQWHDRSGSEVGSDVELGSRSRSRSGSGSNLHSVLGEVKSDSKNDATGY